MKLMLELKATDLPTEFTKYVEQSILRIIPRSHNRKLYVNVKIDRQRTKYSLELQVRGELTYSMSCKNYNPYLLVKIGSQKLQTFFAREANKTWRDNYIRMPGFNLDNTYPARTFERHTGTDYQH